MLSVLNRGNKAENRGKVRDEWYFRQHDAPTALNKIRIGCGFNQPGQQIEMFPVMEADINGEALFRRA